MKLYKRNNRLEEVKTWEEESGFLDFLSSVKSEIDRFNNDFGFGIEELENHPTDIDGDADLTMKTGFVLIRNNALMPELRHCLYTVLKDRMLHGYIGIYRLGRITTLHELDPIADFEHGQEALFGWLKQLVRASVEKTTL